MTLYRYHYLHDPLWIPYMVKTRNKIRHEEPQTDTKADSYQDNTKLSNNIIRRLTNYGRHDTVQYDRQRRHRDIPSGTKFRHAWLRGIQDHD